MTTAPIQFLNVSKKFHRGELHDSLRDLIPALVRRVIRGSPNTAFRKGDFWAVRDVSFEVRPGEALGIIGPNGAGKSTILKLLTGILRPTSGVSMIRGRAGALIEVAAGFHPDLTGRENVFLQGAIMGMRRKEVLERFDRIVAFAGIGEFIDTPVKRYSSGMNARLGFSIAAHLEPDVLIVDEVLAVGDYSFQAKAFGRINELVRDMSIPVVVVSHQLDRVASLCTHCILLDKGSIRAQGTPAHCIEEYLRGAAEEAGSAESSSDPLHVTGISVTPTSRMLSGNTISARITGERRPGVRVEPFAIGVKVIGLHTGEVASVVDTHELGIRIPEAGRFELAVSLQMNVPPGLYGINAFVRDTVRRRPHSNGHTVAVDVEQGTPFQGKIQLNPRVHIADCAIAVTGASGPE